MWLETAESGVRGNWFQRSVVILNLITNSDYCPSRAETNTNAYLNIILLVYCLQYLQIDYEHELRILLILEIDKQEIELCRRK